MPDIVEIGPQCFASEDEEVINWKGRNYVQQGSAELEEIQDALTEQQRCRAVFILVAREALVGKQPYTNGGALTGAIKGKARRVDVFDLIEVAAYLESGTRGQLKVVSESEPPPSTATDAAQRATVDAAQRGLSPEDPCPGDPSHLVRAHFPGGAWYGTSLDHKKVKS